MTHTTTVTAAPVWKIIMATLVDLALIAIPLTLLGISVRAELPETALLMGIAALALITISTVMLARDGQSPGWVLGGLRLSTQGGYPGLGLQKPAGTKFSIADTRNGQDPLLPVSPPPVFSGHTATPQTQVATQAPEWIAPPEIGEGLGEAEHTIFADGGEDRWCIIIDGNSNGPLKKPVVIGRNPSTTEHEQQVAVMDVTRQLSKNHLRLSQGNDGLPVVEDLGSTNGTSLSHEQGPPLTLPPGRRVIIDEHTRVLFSGHELKVAKGGMNLA